MTRRVAHAAQIGALVLALALIPAAIAAKGGKPAGSGGGTSAMLSVSPNPVQAWSAYSLSGCGYVVGKQVTVVINNGTFFGAAVDANGCLAPVSWWASGPGSYRVDAYQRLKSRRQTLMATAMMSVV